MEIFIMKLFATCGRTLVVMGSMLAGVCGAAERTQGGLDVSVRDEATAADAGLPSYPGARPYKDADQSSSGANIGFSVPGFGLKVVAMNLQSGDKPERVAAFYRKALSKYGRVLDCSDAARNKKSAHEEGDDELMCDADDPGSNSIVYKAGTQSSERIVAIKPHGSGTRFSLVHVDKRGEAK
jgi:hypothetical protein